MKTSLRQVGFWILFVLLLAGAGYGSYRFLAGQIFNLMLWQKLMEDPDHRWRPHERPDINSDGLRSPREATDFQKEDFNIIFAGDSFTFGHLLGAEQAPPAQFERLAQARNIPVKVINFGWSSSSPYLSLRLLKDKAALYKPDLVILVLDATDYKDDFFYSQVIERKGVYGWMVEHPLLAHFPRQIARVTDGYTHWQEHWLGYPDHSNYFLFLQPYEKSRPFFERTYSILEEINRFVTKDLGARFVVFVPPRHWQYTNRESPLSWERHNYAANGPYVLNNFVYFQEKSGSTSFPIVPLLDDFKNSSVFPTTFEKDSHWNPDGARFAADLMLQHCIELDCFR